VSRYFWISRRSRPTGSLPSRQLLVVLARSSSITKSVILCRFYQPLTVSQECKDVKEKAKQLIPWLNKLKDNLATIADGIDLEEEQRRAELSR